MAATPDTFPSFAECSRQAREIERNMISVKQNQIAGKLHPEDNIQIFPKEFDEYTAAYLVSEAQKVERRLFASNYQSSLTAVPPSQQARQSLDKEIEELHQFATSPPPVPQQPSSEQQKPSFAEQISNIKFPSLSFGKSAQQQAPAQQQVQQQSPYSQPAPVSPPPQQYAQPPQNYSQSASAPPSTPKIPPAVRIAEETEKDAEENMGKEKEEFEAPSKEAWQDEAGEKAEPLPEQVRSPPSKSSLMASSKVSPRLRAIIEEKLRREEQKEAEKEEDIEIEAQAAPEEPPEQKEDETPILSSRERLMRKLQKEKAKWPKKQAEEEPEEKEAKQPEEQEEEQEEPEEQIKAKETPMRRRTELADSAYGEEVEKAEPAPTEPEAPAKIKSSRAPLQVRTGGITIKPIFSGESEEQPEKKIQSADSESENRMDRIKRIVAELSPDKYKAQAIAPSRSIQNEMDEGSESVPEKGRKKGKAKIAKVKVQPPEDEEQEQPEAEEKEQPGAEQEEEAAPVTVEKTQLPSAKKAVPQKGGRKAAQPQAAKQAKKAVAAAQKPQKKTAPKAKAQLPAQIPKQPVQAKAQPPVQVPKQAVPLLQPVQPTQTKPQPRAPQPVARTPYPTAPIHQAQNTAPQPVSSRVVYSAAQRSQPAQAATAAPSRTLPQQRMAPSVSPVQPGARQRTQVSPPNSPTVLQRASVANIATAPRGNARPLRILPGGVSQQALPRTYVPPIRRKLVPQEQTEEQEQADAEAQPAEEEHEQPEEEKPERIQVTSAKARFQSRGEPPVFSGVKPKKAVLDEPAPEKTAEELEEEKRVSEKAEKLSQMARPRHEIAGDAELPAEQEEETDADIPHPPSEDAEPAPSAYEDAKEGFKRKTEQEGIRKKTNEEVETELEEYAKENMVWLHEIYAMGGMSREDFLQKVKDKIAEESNTEEQQAADAPANPALSNLGKEIDKRYKK